MHHNQGSHGLMSGFFAAIAAIIFIGGGFFIGCIIDFLKHPGWWIQTFGFPFALIIIGLIGGYRSGWK